MNVLFARTGSTNSMFPGTSQEGATCDVMFVQSVVGVCMYVCMYVCMCLQSDELIY